MDKCLMPGCSNNVTVKIIDWENNWDSFCWDHALAEMQNPTPRDA